MICVNQICITAHLPNSMTHLHCVSVDEAARLHDFLTARSASALIRAPTLKLRRQRAGITHSQVQPVAPSSVAHV